MDGKIVNPKTGKKILIGGPTYKKLVKEGIFTDAAHPPLHSPKGRGKRRNSPYPRGEKGERKEKVKSPKTGKMILVGGATYKKLVKEGVEFPPPPKSPKSPKDRRKEKEKERTKSPRSKEKKEKTFKTPEPKVNPQHKTVKVGERRLKPRPHQMRVIEYLRENRGLIACHSTGTGKTLIAVVSAMEFHERTGKDVYFVTPVSLQGNIKKEMLNYGVDPEAKHYKYFTHTMFGKYNPSNCRGDMIIIDEAHNLRTDIKTKGKNKDKMTKARAAVEACAVADRVLLLTATPVVNEPAEMKNLMAMVYGTTNIKTDKELIMLNQNPALMKFFYGGFVSMYYPEKDENYPSMEKVTVTLEMPPSYYRKYRDIELQEGKGRDVGTLADRDAFIFFNGVRMASNGIKDNSPKVEWVVNKILEGERIVIASSFKAYGIRMIQEEIKKHGIDFREITGEMAKAKRDVAMKEYNDGVVNVFFITKAGGEGLDLKATRYMVKFESSFNEATEEQFEGRVRRYGSHTHLPKEKQHVTVYDLILVKPKVRDVKDTRYDSADRILKEIMERKKSKNDAFLSKLSKISIEQYDPNVGNQKLNELKNVPLGNNATAYDLFVDLGVHLLLKNYPPRQIHTQMLERWAGKAGWKEFKEKYNLNLRAPLNIFKYPALVPEQQQFVNLRYDTLGNYYIPFDYKINENSLIYLTKDIATYLLKVDRENLSIRPKGFEYTGILYKSENLYFQWD